jgi:hypothetical protein
VKSPSVTALAVMLTLSANVPCGKAAAEPSSIHAARTADKNRFFIFYTPILNKPVVDVLIRNHYKV